MSSFSTIYDSALGPDGVPVIVDFLGAISQINPLSGAIEWHTRPPGDVFGGFDQVFIEVDGRGDVYRVALEEMEGVNSKVLGLR